MKDEKVIIIWRKNDIVIESIILCALFTIMVYVISRKPINILYNYPPKIQERVRNLEEYKDKIPTRKNKIFIKVLASIIFLVIICIVLRYLNSYTTFMDSFTFGFFIWSIVNLYDAIVLDIIWFCHDSHFVINGTEDMKEEYHNYLFHIKGFFIGEILALIICSLAGLIIQFIL